MVNCEGCGASIDASENTCPYCGHVVSKKVEFLSKERVQIHSDTKRTGIHERDSTYGVVRNEDGTSKVIFGDGVTGRRPSSGADIRAGYRAGAGASGNIPTGIVKKLDKLHDKIKKVPDPSKGKGSRDLGKDLIEAFSIMGDLLALYQSGIAQEAHLSTKDRDRVSKGEKRIIPKLRNLVYFCERVDAKTQQKTGLSDTHMQDIKNAATATLRVVESGICTKCGAMNKSGDKRCRNCGASL